MIASECSASSASRAEIPFEIRELRPFPGSRLPDPNHALTSTQSTSGSLRVFLAAHPHTWSRYEKNRRNRFDIDRFYNAWESNFTLSISPRSLGVAFFSWALHMASLPGKRTELMMEIATKMSRYSEYLQYAIQGREYPGCFTPASEDSRFQGEEWKKWPFNALAQGFLMVESC